MHSRPSVFAKSNSEGKKRVLKGSYAFLMESASIEYTIERECNLTQIGGLLDSKGWVEVLNGLWKDGSDFNERNPHPTSLQTAPLSDRYGIATPKDSPYLRPLSQAILKLQESGVLHQLKDRWWKQKRGGGACADDAKVSHSVCQQRPPSYVLDLTLFKRALLIQTQFPIQMLNLKFNFGLKKKGSSSVTELSLGNVGGVFVVLLGGIAASLIMSIFEFMWRARKVAPDRVSKLHAKSAASYCLVNLLVVTNY